MSTNTMTKWIPPSIACSSFCNIVCSMPMDIYLCFLHIITLLQIYIQYLSVSPSLPLLLKVLTFHILIFLSYSYCHQHFPLTTQMVSILCGLWSLKVFSTSFLIIYFFILSYLFIFWSIKNVLTLDVNLLIFLLIGFLHKQRKYQLNKTNTCIT